MARLSAGSWALLWLFAGASSYADTASRANKLNTRIENITWKDAAGKRGSLHDLKDKKAIVVLFLSLECPVSTSYAPILTDLAKNYDARQVAFLAFDDNDQDSAEQLARQAAEYQLPFPLLPDEHFRAADAFGAKTVPSAFVLDADFMLRYRGRIDNGYAARLKKNARTTRFDLREALEEVLRGKSVTQPITTPIGCAIQRPLAVDRSASVTFHRDVEPILQKSCQECHHPGGIGPFSLLTYRQARTWSDDIAAFTHNRQMPPWKPVEGVAFLNERKLAERDIQTLAAWVKEGAAEGETKDAPPPRKFAEGWQLGKPDLVLTLPADVIVGASGPDLYRCLVYPTHLSENQFVTAVEVRPSNSRIVHHTLNFADKSGKGRALEKKAHEEERAETADRGAGYTVSMGVGFVPKPGEVGGLGGWVPGQMARFAPRNSGFFLPAGSDVILQAHYHRTGRVEKDRTTVGLYFAKDKKNIRLFQFLRLTGRFKTIPAGEERFRVEDEIEIREACELHSLIPHMHNLGRTIQVTLTPPGGKPRTLLTIDDWDFHWQETYLLKEPIALTPGTRLAIKSVFDNSGKNPKNPFSPPRPVKFGQQTTDEMCMVFLGLVSPSRTRITQRYLEPRP